MFLHSVGVRSAMAAGLIALALFACSSDPKPPPPPPYLGHWESVYRGRGGEANGMILRPDSTIDRLTFRAFDFHYSVFGDSLRMVPIIADSLLPPGATEPPIHTNRFTITGDTLMRADSQVTEWLVRESAPLPGAENILGTWRVVRSTAMTTMIGFERFSTDSLLQVRIPAGITTGRYLPRADFADTLRPDSLTFFFPKDTSRCVMTWRGDTLVFTRIFTNGTFSFDYTRAGDSSWYRLIEP